MTNGEHAENSGAEAPRLSDVITATSQSINGISSEQVQAYIDLCDKTSAPIDFKNLGIYLHETSLAFMKESGVLERLDPVDDAMFYPPETEEAVRYMSPEQISLHLDEVLGAGASIDDVVGKLSATALRQNRTKLIEAGASTLRVNLKIARSVLSLR